MTSKKDRQALLQWSSNNAQQPCFCDKDVLVDVVNLRVTPETIAAVFAIHDPESIIILDASGAPVGRTKDSRWPLEPQREYQVVTTEQPLVLLTPIAQLFHQFPGKDDDEKSDRIHALSKHFYGKIWHDPVTPEDFKNYFYSPSSSADIQAFRQFNWLNEVFGGESLYGGAEKRNQVLKPRVMAKHTKSRMTKEHAITWLQLMKRSIEDEFPKDHHLQKMMELYWLHFYAFFPFNDDTRREFKKCLL